MSVQFVSGGYMSVQKVSGWVYVLSECIWLVVFHSRMSLSE